MCPIESSPSLFRRYKVKKIETVDTFKTFHILCEGSVTEKKYFKAISDSNFLSVRNGIKIEVLNKTGNDKGRTQLKELFKLIKQYVREKSLTDDDVPVLVVDFDVHRENANFINDIATIEREGIKVYGNSPCIELWLILHLENAIDEHVKPNREDILKNSKVSNVHTYTSKLASKILGFNTKRNVKPEIVKGINFALDQCNNLENNIELLNKEIGTNFHILINQIILDERFIY